MTGFTLTLDTSGQFSTSAQGIGKMCAADYAIPTPLMFASAISDMGTTFIDTTGHVNLDFTDLWERSVFIHATYYPQPNCSLWRPLPDSGAIGGLTLLPGLYKWTTGVTVDSAETISGAATDSESAHLMAPPHR
jgi:hypothetical protein